MGARAANCPCGRKMRPQDRPQRPAAASGRRWGLRGVGGCPSPRPSGAPGGIAPFSPSARKPVHGAFPGIPGNACRPARTLPRAPSAEVHEPVHAPPRRGGRDRMPTMAHNAAREPREPRLIACMQPLGPPVFFATSPRRARCGNRPATDLEPRRFRRGNQPGSGGETQLKAKKRKEKVSDTHKGYPNTGEAAGWPRAPQRLVGRSVAAVPRGWL